MSTHSKTATLSAPGTTAGACAAVAAALSWPATPAALGQLTSPFPDAMSAMGVLATAVLSGWILLIVIAATLLHVRLPGVPRALQAVLFTTAVSVLAAPSAHADNRHDLDGLPLPDRPVVAEFTTKPPGDYITVQPGDTLWELAAATLPRDASNADIATACHALYHRNREVIGSNPDLIHPGQVLS